MKPLNSKLLHTLYQQSEVNRQREESQSAKGREIYCKLDILDLDLSRKLVITNFTTNDYLIGKV